MATSTIDRKNKKSSLGPIADDVSYPLPLFMSLTGMGAWAIRMAKRQGLKTHQVGNRAFVRGSDWNQYLASLKGRNDA